MLAIEAVPALASLLKASVLRNGVLAWHDGGGQKFWYGFSDLGTTEQMPAINLLCSSFRDLFHTVDGQNPVSRTTIQKSNGMVSKRCEMDFVHPQ